MRLTSTAFLLAASLFAAGENYVTCQAKTIQAEEGDDVKIQCHLDQRVNLEFTTIYISRADLDEVVLLYRNGKYQTAQLDQYRVTLIPEDLKKGILEPLISSVQLNDSGPYKFSLHDYTNSYCDTLDVVKKGQLHRSVTGDHMTTAARAQDPGGEQVMTNDAIVGVVVGVVAPVVIGVMVKCGTIRKLRTFVEAQRKRRVRSSQRSLADPQCVH